MSDSLLAWHFCGDKLRCGSPIPDDGVTLRHDGDLVMCKMGLHASVNIMDALMYAPGYTICRVRVEGHEEQGHTDKLVCRSRTILWRIDGEQVLRDFARWCALQVIHLWDAPSVVKEYLETGKKELSDAARDAAIDADGAARYAARYAAGAARDAAWIAAKYVAIDAARAAAWDAARYAARAAAWTAAWTAARDAAMYAARYAAMDAQNKQLTAMVMEAAGKTDD